MRRDDLSLVRSEKVMLWLRPVGGREPVAQRRWVGPWEEEGQVHLPSALKHQQGASQPGKE